MTPARASAYLGCATILVAWLASAAGIGEYPAAPSVEPQAVQSTGTETLADDVQAQAVRLRTYLSSAPTPQRPARNPFEFAPRATSPRRPSGPPVQPPPPTATVFPEPIMSLVGIAADQSVDGPVRTAVITAETGEIFIVKVGEFIGARYKVESIGTDAVELSDRANGTLRRLALR